MFKAKCSVCNRTNEADNINDSILNIKHHPDCDAEKGMPWNPIVKDTKFS